MTQLGLFAEDQTGTTQRNPLCIYQPHCGHLAVIGPPDDRGGCVNRSIRCVQCGARGESSERKL